MADLVHERVRVAMDEAPLGALTAKHECHAQRPVLIRQAADEPVLPFDRDEHCQVAGGVGLEDLELPLAALEEPAQGLERCVRVVDVPSRLSPDGGIGVKSSAWRTSAAYSRMSPWMKTAVACFARSISSSTSAIDPG